MSATPSKSLPTEKRRERRVGGTGRRDGSAGRVGGSGRRAATYRRNRVGHIVRAVRKAAKARGGDLEPAAQFLGFGIDLKRLVVEQANGALLFVSAQLGGELGGLGGRGRDLGKSFGLWLWLWL